MSLASAIDNLIHKSERREKPADEMTPVHITRDGRIASGFFSRVAATYHVRCDTKIELGDLQLTIRDFRAHRSLPITVRLRLMIPAPGHKAAQSINAHPYRARQTVSNWVQDQVQDIVDKRETEDLAMWLGVNAQDVETKIAQMLADKGFVADVALGTEDLPENSILIETEDFSARPRDIDVRLPMSLSLRLDHIGAADKKPPANETDWRRMIKDTVRDYTERSEELDAVRQRDAFATRLQEHLDQTCRKVGWRIERCDIKIDLTDFSKSISETFQVPWTSTEGRAFHFTIKVAIEIAESGATKYLGQGAPDLSNWTRSQLTEIIDSILFETDTDGLNPTNFGEVQNRLKAELDQRALECGLEVRLVVAEPTIPEWDYLQPREFEIDEEFYDTTSPGTQAVFSLVVTGQFATVGPAFAASRNGGNIARKITDTAIDACRLVMRRTEPADYFAQFRGVKTDDPRFAPRESPVADELHAAIKDRLKKHLNFRLTDVQITQIDPDYNEKREKLRLDPMRTLEVAALPGEVRKKHEIPVGSRPEALLIPFKVSAELTDPDLGNASNLALGPLDLDKIWTMVTHWTQELLDGLSVDELAADSTTSVQELRKRLNDEISAKLGIHGVGIYVSAVQRGNSELDDVTITRNLTMDMDRMRHRMELERIAMKKEMELARADHEGAIAYAKAAQEMLEHFTRSDITSLDEAKRELRDLDRKFQSALPSGDDQSDDDSDDAPRGEDRYSE